MAPKRPGPLVIAALVAGGVAALVALAFFARFMAQRQETECVAAIGAAGGLRVSDVLRDHIQPRALGLEAGGGRFNTGDDVHG